MMQESHDQVSMELERLEADVDNLKEKLDYLSTKRDKVEEEVGHIVDSVQDILREKKDELQKTLNELYSSERQKLLVDIRDKQALVGETKEGLTRMRELMRSNSQDEATNLGRSLTERSLHYGLVYNEEQPRLVDLNLNVNFEEIISGVEKLPFGNVDAVYDDGGVTVMKRFFDSPSPLPSPTSTDCGEDPFTDRAVQKNTIHTRVEGDKTEPKLNDIAVVEVGSIVALVVTDRSNKSIKSFYKRDDMPFYSLESTSTQPRGVARVGNCRVGVTFPEAKAIKILKVTPALRRDREIKTPKRYRGISMLDLEKLVLSTYETFPGSVDILDFQGTILRSIQCDKNGVTLFDYPFYLCTTFDRNIIVSDCERRSISCISQTGDIIFQFTNGGEVPVKYPLGVALDTFGDILVADCDNHKIVKILSDGQGAKEFLGKENGILGPYSIDVDAYGTVYVAQWSGDIKEFSTD